MSEVLLKELSNSDINWIRTVSHQIEVSPGEVLIHPQENVKNLYILISGSLAITTPGEKNILQNAFELLEQRQSSDKEITRLFSGEIVGKMPPLNIWQTSTAVKAVEQSVILSIPGDKLQGKLEQDVNFSARFYRLITILFANKIQNTINQLGSTSTAQAQPLKDIFFILEFLYDSDIDWLISAGKKQEIPANTTLIHEQGAVDAFYILFNGVVSLSVSADKRNALTAVFAAIENQEIPLREITRLSKGEIIGETLFTDSRLPSTTATTVTDSTVLSIDKRVLLGKLEQDIAFAARFYRQMATLLVHRLQKLHSQLRFSRHIYSKTQQLIEDIDREDEMDASSLDKIALSSKRFDWMLAQLKIN
ncbi:MAG: cyclic nucleotide-binding domain-containing protein [Richelia sp. RM2_1_2]|nr:cyclic nucleotide-binding domain-containing protein [Richelia sp. SM1_7_0]NJN11166.1 cyclic nucleotide-binding domain-containing protein [Richelia sp. RM1_1_1]NJO61892.1 cyclic nucleotide-binding domain-containing protein [Richelia sp. RM2_1_2]